MNDTICAISTPIGTGGISIVRLSGANALPIASRVFSRVEKEKIVPRYFYLGNFVGTDFVEKCMMVYFKAPNSYTGEDLVEFHCHGGVLLTRKVLQTLIANGARLAEGGEFSKRAFVNGKLSLDEAEGVIDVINAESDSELRAGYSLLFGKLHDTVAKAQDNITDLLSEIDVTFDFPENDDEKSTADDVLVKLRNVKDNLQHIADTSSTGIKLKAGNKIVIVGKPNVGKSSLMNALLNYDRAIVTDIQGTTRDVLEETYIFRGVKFNLIDTAGLRNSTDVVENIGITRAKQTLNDADLVLFVVDSSTPLTEYDTDIIKLLADKKVLVIFNKTDLAPKVDKNELPFENIIECSALNKTGIDNIKQKIFDMVVDSDVLSSNIIITNERHQQALNRAIEYLGQAFDGLQQDKALELVAMDLHMAWDALGEITGQTNNEQIIGNIFSKFCVGK